MKNNTIGIVLYGAGKEAERFYDEYKKLVSVAFVIAKETTFFRGVKSVFLDSCAEELKDRYIIVATNKVNYYEIRKELERKGLREFEHFCSGFMFEIAYKKIGNGVFVYIKSFSDKLYVYDTWKWFLACARNYCKEKKEQIEIVEKGVILPPVMINGEYRGGVVDIDWTFVAGQMSSGEDRWEKGAPGYWGIRNGYYANVEEEIDEEVIFGGVLFNHFGHFLLDSMSRLWFVRNNLYAGRKIAFIENGHSTWMDELLELLGISEHDVIIVKNPTRFKKVLVPNESMHHLNFCREDFKHVVNEIIARLPMSKQSIEKVYLAKRTNSERVLGEKVFEEYYRKKGYTVIVPEKLPVCQQIAIVHNAKHIVATMGTLSHFSLFCKQGTEFVVLNRNDEYVCVQQIICNEIGNVDWKIIDVANNILPTRENAGINNLGITALFRKYAFDCYSDELEQESMDSQYYAYLKTFCDSYKDPMEFKKKRIEQFDGFELLNKIHRMIYGTDLDRSKYC